MPLPDERKSAGVSSLIRLFREKERQEQNDLEKLKPRASFGTSRKSDGLANVPDAHKVAVSVEDNPTAAPGKVDPVTVAPITQEEADEAAPIAKPSVPAPATQTDEATPEAQSSESKPEEADREPAALSPKLSDKKQLQTSTAPSKASGTPKKRTSTPLRAQENPKTATAAESTPTKSVSPASVPRRGGFMAPTASSAARSTSGTPPKKGSETPTKSIKKSIETTPRKSSQGSAPQRAVSTPVKSQPSEARAATPRVPRRSLESTPTKQANGQAKSAARPAASSTSSKTTKAPTKGGEISKSAAKSSLMKEDLPSRVEASSNMKPLEDTTTTDLPDPAVPSTNNALEALSREGEQSAQNDAAVHGAENDADLQELEEQMERSSIGRGSEADTLVDPIASASPTMSKRKALAGILAEADNAMTESIEEQHLPSVPHQEVS